MDDLNILAVLEHKVEKNGSKNLINVENKTLTYKGFYQDTISFSQYLQQLGMGESCKISIALENHTDFFIALFSIWHIGAIAIPVNPSASTKQLESIFNQTKPDLIILTEKNNFHPASTKYNTCKFKLAKHKEKNIIPFTVNENDLSIILFTSGSTGTPKGVCTTIAKLTNNASVITKQLNFTDDENLFVNVPPYFTSTICHFLAILYVSGQITARNGFLFADDSINLINKYKCTGIGGSPSNFIRLLSCSDPKVIHKNHRFWISSGDHLPISTIKNIKDKFPKIDLHTIYGLTETSGRLCALSPKDLSLKAGSVGKPIKGMQISIKNESNSECSINENGELYVKGQMLMLGYLNSPNLDYIEISEFATGDFGHADNDGYIWLIGRNDDVFKMNGEKISTILIQQALISHNDIEDAGVIAIDDDIFGKKAIAFIRLKKKNNTSSRELKSFLKSSLPDNHIPAKIIFIDNIPRTGSGKVINSELKKLL